jgi:hypothetical protein
MPTLKSVILFLLISFLFFLFFFKTVILHFLTNVSQKIPLTLTTENTLIDSNKFENSKIAFCVFV